ncbi:unnamed protein product [Blepharisma stoltei]|uniref:ATP synthase F0 subunit 8 n=1 Tax=Blepharisma stoltei TaxID=1481888 RepID=A0AAU9K5J5_9CILI|nr:unnamed protein product [Blepharisma stoltei]
MLIYKDDPPSFIFMIVISIVIVMTFWVVWNFDYRLEILTKIIVSIIGDSHSWLVEVRGFPMICIADSGSYDHQYKEQGYRKCPFTDWPEQLALSKDSVFVQQSSIVLPKRHLIIRIRPFWRTFEC